MRKLKHSEWPREESVDSVASSRSGRMLWLLRCEPGGLSDESNQSLGELFCSADEVRASSISELVFRNPFFDPFDAAWLSHASTTEKTRCIETVTITPDVKIPEKAGGKVRKSWEKNWKTRVLIFRQLTHSSQSETLRQGSRERAKIHFFQV